MSPEKLLTDAFSRTINYVRVSVTDRCNLRCKYCVDGRFTFVPHGDIMRYEEILRFVRLVESLGVSKVRLTGGEPLVRKGITCLVHDIAALPGIDDVSLTTNGVFLGEKMADLKEAGLRRVNVSLDTLKKERFAFITGVEALHQVLDSLEKAMSAGLRPVKLNTVIIAGFNDDEILDFAELARRWDIQVRFIEFMPFGDTSLWDRSQIVTSDTIYGIINDRYPLSSSPERGRGPAQTFSMEGGRGKIGFISPLSSHLCATCNRIRLTARGTIRPCLFSEKEFDIKSLIRSGMSDEELRDRIRGIVREKPERRVETGVMKKCQRSMRDIGG
jgi:cyclic pyranopterin phosphate synthase